MATPVVFPCPVFEGSEKRISVFFSAAAAVAGGAAPCGAAVPPGGLRMLSRAQLDGMLDLAACQIVSSRSNEAFDAYVLSESSLFVYPGGWMGGGWGGWVLWRGCRGGSVRGWSVQSRWWKGSGCCLHALRALALSACKGWCVLRACGVVAGGGGRVLERWVKVGRSRRAEPAWQEPGRAGRLRLRLSLPALGVGLPWEHRRPTSSRTPAPIPAAILTPCPSPYFPQALQHGPPSLAPLLPATDRMVLKTCGTTKLLDCIPHMVDLAAGIKMVSGR